MTIVSSTYVEATPLTDGSRSVTETHIDSTGATHQYGWIGTANATTALAAHAVEIADRLAEEEAARLIDGD